MTLMDAVLLQGLRANNLQPMPKTESARAFCLLQLQLENSGRSV